MTEKNINEALVNAYIGTGDKVDKLKNGSFSWCAFFFGPLYFMYRKMVGLGIAILLLETVIASLSIPLSVCLLIDVIISVSLGLLFKKLYVKHVEKETEKIKNSNATKTDEEIITLCTKKGKPSVGMVALGILLSMILLFIVSAINPNSTFSRTMEIINSNDKKLKNLQESLDVSGNIEFELPKGFEKSSISTEMLPVYDYEKDNSSCTLMMATYAQNEGETAKSFIENISLTPGESMGSITTQTINGVEWSKVQVTGQPIYGNTAIYEYYYVVTKNNKIYKVSYSIYRDENGSCANAQEEIVNSLKIKRQ